MIVALRKCLPSQWWPHRPPRLQPTPLGKRGVVGAGWAPVPPVPIDLITTHPVRCCLT